MFISFSVYLIGVFVYASVWVVYLYVTWRPGDQMDWPKLGVTSLIWPAIVIAGLSIYLITSIREMLKNAK